MGGFTSCRALRPPNIPYFVPSENESRSAGVLYNIVPFCAVIVGHHNCPPPALLGGVLYLEGGGYFIPLSDWTGWWLGEAERQRLPSGNAAMGGGAGHDVARELIPSKQRPTYICLRGDYTWIQIPPPESFWFGLKIHVPDGKRPNSGSEPPLPAMNQSSALMSGCGHPHSVGAAIHQSWPWGGGGGVVFRCRA